jgi:acyl-CoA thioester hydrolase
MPEPFRTHRLVEFADTDMAGIVHFARFFCFMESAEHAFLRSLGLSVSMGWEGEHISFPRVSAACDYLRPARFEDQLTIEVTVEKVGRKSVSYTIAFLKEEEVLARGRLTTVCCRVFPDGHLESRDIPGAIVEKLVRGKP